MGDLRINFIDNWEKKDVNLEELGVSHTPVKDALNRLVSEGYVEAMPRRSMVVKEYSNIEFLDNYDQRLMIELYYADEILERAFYHIFPH